MNDRIENYEYLWKDKSGIWALLHINRDDQNETPRYLVVNREDRSALIIEDDIVSAAVKQKMLDIGAPIVWPGNGF